MNEEKFELKGVSPNRGRDPQTRLLDAIDNMDITAFQSLLKTVDPDYFYGYPKYKTCLDIACSKPGYSGFVKHLLNLKSTVDVNKVNEKHGKAPIHFAVEAGDLDTIRTLLDSPNIQVNSMTRGTTAIHLAIQCIDSKDEQSISKYEKIIETLLEYKSDVNIPDAKNITPLSSAARQGLKEIVELILKKSEKTVNPDLYKDSNGNSARMVIAKYIPELLEKLPPLEGHCIEDTDVDVDQLFSHLNRGDEDSFIKDFNRMKSMEEFSRDIFKCHDGRMTLLQKICDIGFDKAARILLDNQADPNEIGPVTKDSPVEIACSNGYPEVLNILFRDGKTLCKPVNGKSLIQIVVKETKQLNLEPKRDYNKCLKILLEHPIIKKYINDQDSKGNTALHYAVRSNDQETTLELLKKGASIVIRNDLKEPPLADISAKTMETYLDGCLTTNNVRPKDESYELHFDYSSFATPRSIRGNRDDETTEPLLGSFFAPLAPKTDVLLYMADCPVLKPLLKHPVITSFLFLKWQRISWLFYVNIAFYTMFCSSLVFYIHLGYGGPILSIFGCFLLIRELLQMVVTLEVYFKSIENWLEILVIGLTAAIVFNNSTSEHYKQQLSSPAILLSFAEWVLLAGHFPFFSPYIVMLKTVSRNFLKLLGWYCVLIFGFALSFYTLFRTDIRGINVAHDENPNFFLNFWTSTFKTILMLTGEFDAASIEFNTFPVISHVIFLVFVFMIPIVLFNLLNGLAVSDIQAIQANAKIEALISRIRLVWKFERVILGNWSWFKNGICILPNASCMRSGRICFKTSSIVKVCVNVTNKTSRVEMYHEDENDPENRQMSLCCQQQCSQSRLHWKIVKAAMQLVAEREEGASELEQLQDKLQSFQQSLQNIEVLLERNFRSQS